MTDLVEAILGTRSRVAEFPTGTVTTKSSTTMTVLVRGVTITAAYIDLGASTPIVGDLVVLGRQDATWVVLGRQAGVGTNQVLNFSFEQDGEILTTPSNWFLYAVAGAGAPRTIATGYAPDGTYELGVNASAGAAQDTFVYSSPISVAPGQVWALSALASAVYPAGAAITATGSVYGLWFANDTNLYPTTSAADSLVATATLNPAPTHASISGTVTVPAATTYMRVGLRSVTVANVTALWDAVIARRVG